jgi:hypothetical protein
VVLSFGSLSFLRANSLEISVDFLLIWYLDAVSWIFVIFAICSKGFLTWIWSAIMTLIFLIIVNAISLMISLFMTFSSSGVMSF